MLIDGVIAQLQNTPAFNTATPGGVHENELPRGYILPCAAAHQYGGTRESQMSGPVDPGDTQVQFDCYGRTGLEARQSAAAIRAALEGFTGTLPDGTVVQRTMMDRSQALPFLPNADQKGIANRWMIGFTFTTVNPSV